MNYNIKLNLSKLKDSFVDTILDNCMGSGTTAIACIREKRHFIGFELNKEFFDKASERIKDELYM